MRDTLTPKGWLSVLMLRAPANIERTESVAVSDKQRFVAPPMSIGADDLPGVAKALEECGEFVQVAGKLIATDGRAEHWDGTDLHVRLVEEVGDVIAAMQYLVEANALRAVVGPRVEEKLARFRRWHGEEQAR